MFFSLLFLNTIRSFRLQKKNAEEQLLRYFNYSPNCNDNLVTLS